MLSKRNFRPKDTYRLKVREWKNIFHVNGKHKKAGVAILILDKIDLKIKRITRDKEGHYIMIKGSIEEEDITRREVKSKGEKERYKHLNAQFQRIAKRDKKALFSDQCKEIEEENRWERLEISSGKLEIPREHFMQDGLNKRQKWYGPNRSTGY